MAHISRGRDSVWDAGNVLGREMKVVVTQQVATLIFKEVSFVLHISISKKKDMSISYSETLYSFK